MRSLVSTIVFFALTLSAQATTPQERFVYDYLGCDEELMTARLKNNAVTQCEADLARDYCKRFYSLPEDAQNGLDLSFQCRFLASEKGNAPADKQKEIEEVLSGQCASVDQGREALMKKYDKDPIVLRELMNIRREYEQDFESKCPDPLGGGK